MFGAVYGDIIGSYYEVRCTKDYNFPLENDSTFTDDSVLIAAVCKTILDNPGDISRFGVHKRAAEFAAQYRQYYSYFPDAGFGNMFSKWAGNYSAPYNRSYANGAAMRVPPIAYAYDDFEQMMRQVRSSCLPTHNNREAVTGAKAVAAAVYMARSGESKESIRSYISGHYYRLPASLKELRGSYVFNSRASYSVPPAIVAFLDSEDYESAIRGAISLGGDADTQACISGAIAEAFYKKIPDELKAFCSSRLDMTIKSVICEFCDKYGISH